MQMIIIYDEIVEADVYDDVDEDNTIFHRDDEVDDELLEYEALLQFVIDKIDGIDELEFVDMEVDDEVVEGKVEADEQVAIDEEMVEVIEIEIMLVIVDEDEDELVELMVIFEEDDEIE